MGDLNSRCWPKALRLTQLALAAVAIALVLPASAIATAPEATTRPAQNVTATSALLRGLVQPNDKPTSWHFEYATKAEFEATGGYPHATEERLLATGVGSAQVPILFVESGVSYQLTGLNSHTTYHFRLVATNSDGTAFGQDLTFKTLKP